MFAVDWYLPNWRAEEIKTNVLWSSRKEIQAVLFNVLSAL